MNSTTARIHFWWFAQFCFLASHVAVAQYNCLSNIDFGRNYLSLPSDNISLDLYSATDKDHAPVWKLDFGRFQYARNTYFVRAWLTNLKEHTSQNASTRLIEVERVDEYALPVLAYSPDSLWIQVSLDCRNQTNPPAAWLYVYDALAVNAKIKSWTNFFTSDQSVVFICDSTIAFYSRPQESSRVFPKLVGDTVRPDYSMRVIKTLGSWMQVYLYTPSDFPSLVEPTQARAQSKNPPPKYWIRYLDNCERPRIWYLWE